MGLLTLMMLAILVNTYHVRENIKIASVKRKPKTKLNSRDCNYACLGELRIL